MTTWPTLQAQAIAVAAKPRAFPGQQVDTGWLDWGCRRKGCFLERAGEGTYAPARLQWPRGRKAGQPGIARFGKRPALDPGRLSLGLGRVFAWLATLTPTRKSGSSSPASCTHCRGLSGAPRRPCSRGRGVSNPHCWLPIPNILRRSIPGHGGP